MIQAERLKVAKAVKHMTVAIELLRKKNTEIKPQDVKKTEIRRVRAEIRRRVDKAIQEAIRNQLSAERRTVTDMLRSEIASFEATKGKQPSPSRLARNVGVSTDHAEAIRRYVNTYITEYSKQ